MVWCLTSMVWCIPRLTSEVWCIPFPAQVWIPHLSGMAPTSHARHRAYQAAEPGASPLRYGVYHGMPPRDGSHYIYCCHVQHSSVKLGAGGTNRAVPAGRCTNREMCHAKWIEDNRIAYNLFAHNLFNSSDGSNNRLYYILNTAYFSRFRLYYI